MYIVAHNKFGQLVKTPVTSVVVYDDFDQPLSVAVQIMDRTATIAHRLDKDFDEVLKNLGIINTKVDLIALDGSKL